MKKIFLLLTVSFFLSDFNIQGQESLQSGNALIFKDPRIDYLQKVYAEKNKIRVEIKSIFRIQIIASKSRSEVNDIKAKFSSKYPEIPVFVNFSPPTFRLRAGNFISREDAQTFLTEIRKSYPASFIVER